MSKYNCTNCNLIIECLQEAFYDEDKCLKIKLEKEKENDNRNK